MKYQRKSETWKKNQNGSSRHLGAVHEDGQDEEVTPRVKRQRPVQGLQVRQRQKHQHRVRGEQKGLRVRNIFDFSFHDFLYGVEGGRFHVRLEGWN